MLFRQIGNKIKQNECRVNISISSQQLLVTFQQVGKVISKAQHKDFLFIHLRGIFQFFQHALLVFRQMGNEIKQNKCRVYISISPQQ